MNKALKTGMICLLAGGMLTSLTGCAKPEANATTAAPSAVTSAVPAAEPPVSEGMFIVDDEAYLSSRHGYIKTARAILAGKTVENADFPYSDPFVYFRLEEDGFKAYANCDPDYETVSGLIASYPREVGELAAKKLNGYVNEFLSAELVDPTVTDGVIYEGFAGKDWFAIVTLDDTIQDIQVHCIFRYDGSEWKEIIGNNKGIVVDGSDDETGSDDGNGFPVTVSGISVAPDGAAYLCYSSKHLYNANSGFTRPYVYRTADGGNTWERLSIVLPEKYFSEWGAVPLAPVFDEHDPMHGIMIIANCDSPEWFETTDGGLTWEYKTAAN